MCFLGCRLFVDVPSVFPVGDNSGLLSAKLWPLKMPTSTAHTCNRAHTHIPIFPHFPFFLPHWRATVALMLHILSPDVGVLQPRQRASHPVWCIFSPRAREYRLIYLQRSFFRWISGHQLHSSEEPLFPGHPHSQHSSALAQKMHSVSTPGRKWRDPRPAASVMTTIVHSVELLTALSLSWQPASMWTKVPPCGHFSFSILYFCTSVWVLLSHLALVNSFGNHTVSKNGIIIHAFEKLEC